MAVPSAENIKTFSSPLQVAVLSEIAKLYNKTPQQVALAWLLSRSPNILPVPGTLYREHLLGNIAALAFNLSEQDLKRINALRLLDEN